MFRDFRLQPQSREADATSHYGPADQDVLYESSLNYFTLHKIGHVRIEWVNTLIDHLRFDRSARILHVFRLPTFCVANIIGRGTYQQLLRESVAFAVLYRPDMRIRINSFLSPQNHEGIVPCPGGRFC